MAKPLEQQLLDAKSPLGGLPDILSLSRVPAVKAKYPHHKTVGEVRRAIRHGTATAAPATPTRASVTRLSPVHATHTKAKTAAMPSIPKVAVRAHASAKSFIIEHPWLIVGGVAAVSILAYFALRSSSGSPSTPPQFAGPAGTGPLGTASTTVPPLPASLGMPATVTPAAPYTFSTIFDADVQPNTPWYATLINPIGAALASSATPSGHWKVVDSLGLTLWISGYRGKDTPPPDAVVRAQLMAHYSALGTSNPYVVAQLQTQQGQTVKVSGYGGHYEYADPYTQAYANPYAYAYTPFRPYSWM